MNKITCEQFYFEKIAQAEVSAEDYRRFFAMLWEAHGQTMFLLAFGRLGKVEDARDVCQDAFVRAMQFIQENPGRIPLKVNFRAWLRKIVANLINDRFRKVLVTPTHVSEDVLEMAPVEQSPEERDITEDDLAVLRECLKSLNERARTLVVLRDLDGVREKEIAARFNMDPNAVYVALHRARKTLRECVSMGQVSERG